MFRGLVRDTPAFPTSVQEAILIEAGVPERAIYHDDFSGAIKSLRKGNKLVVPGFRTLGETQREIIVAIDAVHDRDCAVMDATTKRLSTTKKLRDKLIAEAVADLANEKRGPRKDGHKGQMPWDQINALWKDTTLKTAAIMLRVNAGRRGRARLSQTTIWRKLGKRGALPGRPSKHS